MDYWELICVSLLKFDDFFVLPVSLCFEHCFHSLNVPFHCGILACLNSYLNLIIQLLDCITLVLAIPWLKNKLEHLPHLSS
jgi:hypothetical protein